LHRYYGIGLTALPQEPDQRLFKSAIISQSAELYGSIKALTDFILRTLRRPHLATEKELSDFLKSVERRAFKRAAYHVRNDESALDIVQDSMMKLAEHYGHKPVEELPMLFQRILSNSTLDWFRRQKTYSALFSTLSDFESGTEDEDFNLLESLVTDHGGEQSESAETKTERAQTLLSIEEEILRLPPRQREAFLMRYWEDMDVAETATAMGCSQGSVKTHCSRAVQALGNALKGKGIRL
jgi:RNA polymerase sigma-70 factor (ECF subfamily)